MSTRSRTRCCCFPARVAAVEERRVLVEGDPLADDFDRHGSDEHSRAEVEDEVVVGAVQRDAGCGADNCIFFKR